MYRQFNIQQFYVLSSKCIYVFCVDLRTNSDYFPIQHQLTGFYDSDLTLYSPVVTICTASLTFNNSTFCPHTVLICFLCLRQHGRFIVCLLDWLFFFLITSFRQATAQCNCCRRQAADD